MDAKRNSDRMGGFTIVELLTVMGVIAIIMGLLVPALTMVNEKARDLQQRSQFHSIEVGLEMYKTELGKYPESNNNIDEIDSANDNPDDGFAYTGANKLAEAMVGMDYLGFHPRSEFRSDGEADDGTGTGTDEVIYEGAYRDERKDLFIDLENANAFPLDDIYASSVLGDFYIDGNNEYSNLVLCDVYAKGRASGEKTGMPILYFKAREGKSDQDSTIDADGVGGNLDDDIYYVYDNYHILQAGIPDDTSAQPHPVWGGGLPAELQLNFENMILNDQVTYINQPYRASSYILMSAGRDGLYGNANDVYNFKKED